MYHLDYDHTSLLFTLFRVVILNRHQTVKFKDTFAIVHQFYQFSIEINRENAIRLDSNCFCLSVV
ncbi:hypothetical protein NARC_10160 [Candidatus Nitrosocosmicus arcticus]|uniref:Uncharacterized protein n=1 Tax=Candidatus Nitrosocosmicus arcticus TaxID=2035267 RepID=A0A557SYS8_9ARCH|nr:hypothetical protein NARC_10160 [Candidatus Nitrosocosmicus arcticus]